MTDHLEKAVPPTASIADTEGLTFRKAFIDAGFHLAGVCIWVKNSLVLGRSDYQWQHEPILYGFYKTVNIRGTPTASKQPSGTTTKPKRNKDHPTSKPLDLLGYPIQNSSQENSVVIDTFGRTLTMACEQLNRICYMMELDPKSRPVICAAIISILQNTGKISLLEDIFPDSETVRSCAMMRFLLRANIKERSRNDLVRDSKTRISYSFTLNVQAFNQIVIIFWYHLLRSQVCLEGTVFWDCFFSIAAASVRYLHKHK